MSEVIKTEIKQRLETILSLDIEKLYPTSQNAEAWNGISSEEIKKYVNSLMRDLGALKSSRILIDNISPLVISGLNQHLLDVVNDYNSQLQSTDVGQITNHHHGTLNRLQSLWDFLVRHGITSDIRISQVIDKKIPSVKEGSVLAEALLKNKDDIDSALEQARAWLNVRKDAHNKTIHEQAEGFHDLARDHKVFRGWGPDTFQGKNDKVTGLFERFWRWICWFICGFKGTWIWIFFAFLFAASTAAVTYFFIISPAVSNAVESPQIGLGNAILRVTSLVVPAYLTLFCANQFLYHKKMCDSYMFKYSSLITMNYLIATHEQRADRILDEGLRVLFSEPQTGEKSGKYDPQLVNEIIKILRDQINRG